MDYEDFLDNKAEVLKALHRCTFTNGVDHVLIHEFIQALEEDRDDLEDRLSAYLCDSTGGLMSKTGYDVRTMVSHTEEYYRKIYEQDALSGLDKIVQYGAETVNGTIMSEYRGTNYATHQRSVYFSPWIPIDRAEDE